MKTEWMRKISFLRFRKSGKCFWMERGFFFDVDLVERRCRPCEDKHSNPDWECMSSTGFLAKEENLIAVIERDAVALSRLQTSRAVLARGLRDLMASCVGDEGVVVFAGREWQFRRSWFVSPQYSPFRQANVHVEGWSEEWKVKSVTLKMVLTRGVVDMIEDFGFFEGGLDGSNRYRVDPDVAASCVNGQDLSAEGQNYCLLVEQHKKAVKVRQREELLAEMAPRMHEPGAREFVEHQLAKLGH
jgi:hypothetical protein